MSRNKFLVLGFLVMLALVVAPAQRLDSQGVNHPEPVLGGGTAPQEAPRDSTVTITVDWVDKPLRDALKYIAEKSGINIVPDLGITDEDHITITFHNLDWRKALEEIARLTGCVIEEVSPDLIRFNKPPKVKMDLKNAPIEEVIRTIAKLAGVNIIIATEVKGTVTLTLSEVPWLNALESIAKTSGFALVKESYNVIRVVKPEALAEQLETRVFKLKYLKPPEPYTAKIETAYAVGSPKPVMDAIKEFTVLNILKSMLTVRASRAIGLLEYDIKTNTIIVKDIKPVLDEMQKVIDRLDVEPAQVLIEVKYVSTADEDLLNFGINYAWGDRGGLTMETTPREGGAYGSGTTRTSLPARTRLPFMLGRAWPDGHTQTFLNSYEVTAALRLFKKDTQSKLMQVPSIVALDGKEATIFVGESVHYAQTTASTNQYGGIEYSIAEASRSPVKIGFQLLVIPHIIKEVNQVLLTVIPQDEFLIGKSSPLTGFERFAVRSGTYEQYIDLPRVKRSVAVTNLIVESSRTAVVGGLTIDRTQKIVNKVPFLCDIPIMGNLFKYQEDMVTKDHLLIFITPYILRNAQESMELFQNRAKEQEKQEQKKQ